MDEKFWWVLLLVLALVALSGGKADAGPVADGGNCYGLTRVAGEVVAVEQVWPAWVVTVTADGLQDRVSTMRRYRVGDAVRVTGIVCWGQLDVLRFGR